MRPFLACFAIPGVVQLVTAGALAGQDPWRTLHEYDQGPAKLTLCNHGDRAVSVALGTIDVDPSAQPDNFGMDEREGRDMQRHLRIRAQLECPAAIVPRVRLLRSARALHPCAGDVDVRSNTPYRASQIRTVRHFARLVYLANSEQLTRSFSFILRRETAATMRTRPTAKAASTSSMLRRERGTWIFAPVMIRDITTSRLSRSARRPRRRATWSRPQRSSP